MSIENLTLLRSLIERQDYSGLHSAYSEVIDQEVIDAHFLPVLSLTQALLEESNKAVETLKKAEEKLAELDVDAKVDLAAAYLVLFRVDRAIELLKDALSYHAEHDLGLARLGLAYLAKGEMAKAQPCFERSLEQKPERLTVLLKLIFIDLQQQQMDSAELRLVQAKALLAETQNDLPAETWQRHLETFDSLQLTLWVKQGEFGQAEQWLQNQNQDADRDKAGYLVGQYARVLAECDCHEQAEAVLREALRAEPDNAPLVLQWVELARLQGRMPQAINLLERLIARDEKNPEWWIQLASACLPRLEVRALKAAEKAIVLCDSLQVSEDMTLQQVDVLKRQAKLALAKTKSAQQQFDESEQLFKELLAENAHFAPVLRELGSQYLQQGRIEEAIEQFEHLTQIDPVTGHGALIGARKFPEDEQTLEKLDEVAHRPSLEGSLRSGILFNLAAAWEKRKDYERAFAYANKANQASRRFLRYQPQQHRNQCALVRAMFTQQYFSSRKDFGIQSSLPVFVVGMPRSGTTLVEQIIAGHSEIFGAGELGVIPSRIAGLERWERQIGSGRSYPVCMDDMTAYISKGVADNVLQELQGYTLEAKPGAKHVVDKLPHNFENIGFIKLLFPNAKIISVRRDSRDIALSNYFTDYQAKHGGMGFAYDMTWIGEQLADHDLLMHHWQRLFPDEILEIRYEDVIEDTELMAKKMLEFIGVDWEEQVLAFNELERPVKTASVWQVRQPIYKTSKAKWMNYQSHLEPLIQAINAPIRPDPCTIRLLPVPGMYSTAGTLYKQDRLDEAEYEYKKLLHHIPDHGAANYQVGIIYWRKGHLIDGIAFLEKALKKCPWQPIWREALIQAYKSAGKTEQLKELQAQVKYHTCQQKEGSEVGLNDEIAYLTTSMSQTFTKCL